MPPSANLALREIGIVLFLAVVGFKSGAGFIDTLINGDGPAWMMYGVAITLIPLLLVGVLARHYGKLNYLTLCGLLAGSMTDPPALAFANGMHPTSGASALSYATVYPGDVPADHLAPAAGHPALGRCLTPHETGADEAPVFVLSAIDAIDLINFIYLLRPFVFTPKPGFISVCSFDFSHWFMA